MSLKVNGTSCVLLCSTKVFNLTVLCDRVYIGLSYLCSTSREEISHTNVHCKTVGVLIGVLVHMGCMLATVECRCFAEAVLRLCLGLFTVVESGVAIKGPGAPARRARPT